MTYLPDCFCDTCSASNNYYYTDNPVVAIILIVFDAVGVTCGLVVNDSDSRSWSKVMSLRLSGRISIQLYCQKWGGISIYCFLQRRCNFKAAVPGDLVLTSLWLSPVLISHHCGCKTRRKQTLNLITHFQVHLAQSNKWQSHKSAWQTLKTWTSRTRCIQ